MTRSRGLLIVGLTALLAAAGCADDEGPPVDLRIPPGASFSQAMDTLRARGVVQRPGLFTLYARFKGADRAVRAGRYRLPAPARWGTVIDALTQGRVVSVPLTIPEGWTLRQIAPAIAEFAGVPLDRVRALLEGDSAAVRLGLEGGPAPGTGLEGYLFPDTYLFAEGTDPETIIRTMVTRFEAFWSPDRLARLDSLEMVRHEVVTLASIVQAEAGNLQEMDTIAGVYVNRLRRGWLLQADPTVLYALGGPRERLLFAAIDSVADNPYNTYRQSGLPPGPIGAPGAVALDAALRPAEVPYMFFVAGPHGGHVFTTTQAEHARAAAEYRRRQFRERDEDDGAPQPNP